MQETENEGRASAEFETLRVRAELKQRVLTLQNAYFDRHKKKITVTKLIEDALDEAEPSSKTAEPSAVKSTIQGDSPDLDKLRELLTKEKRTAVETVYFKIIRAYLDEIAVPEFKKQELRDARKRKP